MSDALQAAELVAKELAKINETLKSIDRQIIRVACQMEEAG